MGATLEHLGVILGPSRGHLGHLGAVLGHFGAISGSYHVHLAPFQVYDFGRWMVHSRLCEIRTSLRRDAHSGVFGTDLRPLQSVLSLFFGRLRAISGPSLGGLGAILGPLKATLGRLGSSWVDDRRWHSRFVKICTPQTRVHHSEVVCGPNCHHFGVIFGYLGSVFHLRLRGGFFNHFGAISGSFYIYLL